MFISLLDEAYIPIHIARLIESVEIETTSTAPLFRIGLAHSPPAVLVNLALFPSGDPANDIRGALSIEGTHTLIRNQAESNIMHPIPASIWGIVLMVGSPHEPIHGNAVGPTSSTGTPRTVCRTDA